MMRSDGHSGHPAQPSLSAVGFDWPALKNGVATYLEQQGVPSAQAERFSREIIAQCADQAELIGAARMGQRVHGEAQTLLEGWQAARRTTLLGAA